VTGESEFVLMSPEREASAGREASQQVEQEMGLVQDPAITGYVSALGARLAAQSPRKDTSYRFFVASMPETNAFALPGGYIYVSRGLLALANSEDELACVIGHEIGHVAARHSAQRETRAAGVGLLSALGTIAAAVLGGAEAAQAAAQLGQVAGAGLIASYGRDQERQADTIGQQMAAKAGFDPAGMASFLRSLERETTLQLGKTRRPSFLDSHPATPERAATAAGLARQLGSRGAAPDAAKRAAFLQRFEGVMVGEDPAEGVVRDNLFLHPDMDFRLRFPTDWRVQNGRSAVGAMEPQGAAMIVLEAQEKGDDPRAAAQRYVNANAQGLQIVDHGPTRVGGARAYRARALAASQQGTLGVHFTWIAHHGMILRLQGVTAQQSLGRFGPLFERTAENFRPLTPDERSSIRERRLHIATARAGEMLEALSERTGNAWSLEQTAVANNLVPHDRLEAGQRVKVVVERPYRGGAGR
jgi:predicted Zn-dependent protease